MELRTQQNVAERTVGDIVSDNYAFGSVFKRFGIDFCCGGGRTITEACDSKGVDVDELLAELSKADGRSGASAPDPRGWKLDFLADYITNVHHGYVREQLPTLLAFSTKVARVHGDSNPELIEVAGLVHELAGELTAHLADEEETLFPYVRQLVRGSVKEEAVPMEVRTGQTIGQMLEEHDHAGALMAEIRELTADFTPPPHACNTYRSLFVSLAEFEEDLHRHVHLENNVLFPRISALENGDAGTPVE